MARSESTSISDSFGESLERAVMSVLMIAEAVGKNTRAVITIKAQEIEWISILLAEARAIMQIKA